MSLYKLALAQVPFSDHCKLVESVQLTLDDKTELAKKCVSAKQWDLLGMWLRFGACIRICEYGYWSEIFNNVPKAQLLEWINFVTIHEDDYIDFFNICASELENAMVTLICRGIVLTTFDCFAYITRDERLFEVIQTLLAMALSVNERRYHLTLRKLFGIKEWYDVLIQAFPNIHEAVRCSCLADIFPYCGTSFIEYVILNHEIEFLPVDMYLTPPCANSNYCTAISLLMKNGAIAREELFCAIDIGYKETWKILNFLWDLNVCRDTIKALLYHDDYVRKLVCGKEV